MQERLTELEFRVGADPMAWFNQPVLEETDEFVEDERTPLKLKEFGTSMTAPSKNLLYETNYKSIT
jgi:hypothetical protein